MVNPGYHNTVFQLNQQHRRVPILPPQSEINVIKKLVLSPALYITKRSNPFMLAIIIIHIPALPQPSDTGWNSTQVPTICSVRQTKNQAAPRNSSFDASWYCLSLFNSTRLSAPWEAYSSSVNQDIPIPFLRNPEAFFNGVNSKQLPANAIT
jgi:hypothetical protein